MRRLLLAGLVLFSSVLPGSASALTMLDPGGSAVNPIYVQDVTPHQLQQPQQTGMSYEEYLRKMNPGVTQQIQPSITPVYSNPQSDPYSCKANDPYSYNPAGKVGCDCLPGYQWTGGGTGPSGLHCAIIPPKAVTPVMPVQNVQQVVPPVSSVVNSAAIAPAAAPITQKPLTCSSGQQIGPDGSCISYQRACVTNYGSNSVWTGEVNKAGGAVCGCAQWYQTGPDNKSCVPMDTNSAAVSLADTPIPQTHISWWARFLNWLGL